MLKLMKYEFRKSGFSRMILFVVIGIFELVFLYGALFNNNQDNAAIAWGIAGLVFGTVAGLSFIGIESMLTLHKDLNTKQSYMLFMTPRNGFQILGAKILENGAAILVTAVFFLVLAGADISILLVKYGDIKELIRFIQEFLSIDVPWDEIMRYAAIVFGEAVVSWFAAIVTGYLAIIISSTMLAGKKLSGLVSFVLYIILVIVQERVISMIIDVVPGNMNTMGQFGLQVFITLIFSVAVYVVSCIIIDKKLSV